MTATPTLADRALLVVALLVGLAAVVGGAALVADPRGGLLGLSLYALARSPFETYLVPGSLLVLVVGGSQIVAMLAHARNARLAPAASLAAGVVLLGWLSVQIVMLGPVQPIQVAMIALAVIQIALSAVDLRAHLAATSA